MKFLVLMYAEPDAWSPDEHREALAESVDLCHELHGEDQYLSAAPLQPVTTAISVRVRDGRRLVTDGPFAETKEHLGGYFLIDVASLDEAVEIASRIPGTRRGTAEIRPIVELPNLPNTAARST